MYKVSIGIPAYNEEANIKHLLESLLKQKQDNFELQEIIVFSDASTDKTVELANSFGDWRIRVIDNKERQGQTGGQNQIIKLFTGDILILLNADILPADEDFLHHLVEPFYENPAVGLVSCAGAHPRPKTFVEKVLNFSRDIVEDITKSSQGTENVYFCHGYARAFSKKFAKTIEWPKSVGEDAYSYFLAKSNEEQFFYQPKAVVLYRMPQTLKDHFKQSVRFAFSQKRMQIQFPHIDIRAEYAISKPALALVLIKHFFRHPILTISYLFFQILALFNPYKVTDTNIWEPSQSSKNLVD